MVSEEGVVAGAAGEGDSEAGDGGIGEGSIGEGSIGKGSIGGGGATTTDVVIGEEAETVPMPLQSIVKRVSCRSGMNPEVPRYETIQAECVALAVTSISIL